MLKTQQLESILHEILFDDKGIKTKLTEEEIKRAERVIESIFESIAEEERQIAVVYSEQKRLYQLYKQYIRNNVYQQAKLGLNFEIQEEN
jgi:fructose-specific phosphotransferase system component IIB